MFYVYLARCIDDTFYIGYTSNLRAREKRHNAGKGARYTRTRLPIKFIYFEEFETISEAMSREYELKQLRRHEKEWLILDAQREGREFVALP